MVDIKTPHQLLEYMKKNIRYGWIGIDGSEHIEKLKNFRLLYHTRTLEQILKTGIGTCIESAVIAKSWFDSRRIENRLFCHRSYETEENFDKEVKMHIIILYKEDDKWIHFEHSNVLDRGLHKYESIEEAVRLTTAGFKERGDIRKLTEINEVPSGLSFKEFNNYVNDSENLKKNLFK